MDARKFVETLFGGREGFIEFRLIGGGKATQHFHKISDVLAKWDECLNVLKKANASGANVYFGAVPRTVAKGDAASVAPTTILWADIDDKSSAVNENFKPLLGLNLAPSIVVDSGHGWHCYWILREPLGNETARTIMDEIARVVGGDNVSDPPRILRLPDTFNTKSSPSVLCRVVKADTSRLYNPSDFDRLKDLPSAPGAKAKAKGTEPPKAEPPRKPVNGTLSGYLLPVAKMLSPFWHNGARHKTAMGVAGLLKRNEVDQETASKVVKAIADLAGDEEIEDRLKTVETTYASPEIASTSALEEALGDEEKNFLQTFNRAVCLIPPPPIQRTPFPKFEIEKCIPISSPILNYVAWATLRTDAPPLFHVAGFITLCAAVLGNKVSVPYFGAKNLYANLYTLLAAPSSRFRKSTSIALVREVGKAVQVPVFPNNATTERLYSLFAPDECEWKEEESKKGGPPKRIPVGWEGKPWGIIYHPEFQSYLDTSSKSYMADLRSMMMDFYDGAVDRSTSSRETKTQGRYYISDPAISMLCAATPASVREFVGRTGLQNGFLTRFMLVMPSPEHDNRFDYDDAGNSSEAMNLFSGVCDRVKEMMMAQGVVQIGRGARDVLCAFDAEVCKRIKECEGSEHRELDSLLARLPSMAWKVSMIYGAFHQPLMEITQEDAIWATGLCRYFLQTLPHLYEWIETDDGNREARYRKKVLEVARGIVRRDGQGPIRHKRLLQCSNLDAQQFNRAITSLIEEGRMVRAVSGGRAQSYSLNETECVPTQT